MRFIFLDTSFLYALPNPADQLHQVAIKWREVIWLQPRTTFLTTRSALIEFLGLTRRGDGSARVAADPFVADAISNDRIEVLVESTGLLTSALNLSRARSDKAYSMADCLAMEVCRERKVLDVLTYDRGFVRDGFGALLCEDPGR